MPLHRLGQLGTALLGVSLLAPPLAATAVGRPDHGLDAVVSSAPSRHPGAPTNAGKIHKWGDSQWHDDFIAKQLSDTWKIYDTDGATDSNGQKRSPGQVALQHGMLTINGTGDATSDATTGAVELINHGRRYGRWEIRARSKQYSTLGTPYHVIAGLVPDGDRASNCGARDINYAEFDIGSNRSRINIHNLPDVRLFYGKALHPTEWHDYAVEISKTHISWFVDGRVKMTDKRPAALSGVMLAPTFQIDASAGSGNGSMNKGRMQMDWIRYYTLKRGNQGALPSHAAHQTTNAAAC
jgi:Glycosyl hydrolases family 16